MLFPFSFRAVVRDLADLGDAELRDAFRRFLGAMGTIRREAHADGAFAFGGTLEKSHALTPKISDAFIPGRGFWNRQPLCRYDLHFAFRRDGPDLAFEVRGQVAPNLAFAFNLLFAVAVWSGFYLALPPAPGLKGAAVVFLLIILGLLIFLQVQQQILVRRAFRRFLSDQPMVGIADLSAGHVRNGA